MEEESFFFFVDVIVVDSFDDVITFDDVMFHRLTTGSEVVEYSVKQSDS